MTIMHDKLNVHGYDMRGKGTRIVAVVTMMMYY